MNTSAPSLLSHWSALTLMLLHSVIQLVAVCTELVHKTANNQEEETSRTTTTAQ